MDGTGQWVQLLQWYSEFNPHVTGHQISAGHAAMAKTLSNNNNKKKLSRGKVNLTFSSLCHLNVPFINTED